MGFLFDEVFGVRSLLPHSKVLRTPFTFLALK